MEKFAADSACYQINMDKNKAVIEAGRTVLGIEFGSTRIKAVLIDEQHVPLAFGTHAWENRLVDGLWTYTLDDIWSGLQACYADLLKNVKEKYGIIIHKIGAMGISAMMHGYMAFDRNDALLVPFRTWRNTNTLAASDTLTELFHYNIPLRWSIAHLYQCILDGEKHVDNICYISTLAGYIHWQLTGKKVLGIGDASGMFPIDITAKNYNQSMMCQFDTLIEEKQYPWKLQNILPKVLLAGENAGCLTEAGAKRLDVSGQLQAGVPFCPAEGDAGTGMAATNSIAPKTGNVSAGTSVFAMIVLEKGLSAVHKEIDMVTTPAGDLVAMAHANNCTSDLNAWVGLFDEFASRFGIKIGQEELYSVLFHEALSGDADCGNLMSCGFYSGESIVPLQEGRPLFVRTPNSRFTLSNFMKTHLYAALATLKVGMDILTEEEQVQIEQIYGHGGWFKTPEVGQRIMAAAMRAPVSVMETAGEGGAWGIALLASYMLYHDSQSLTAYLSDCVFSSAVSTRLDPLPEDVDSFAEFVARFKKTIPVEQQAIDCLH